MHLIWCACLPSFLKCATSSSILNRSKVTSVFPYYKHKKLCFSDVTMTAACLLSAWRILIVKMFFQLQLCTDRGVTCVLGRTCSRNISLCTLDLSTKLGRAHNAAYFCPEEVLMTQNTGTNRVLSAFLSVTSLSREACQVSPPPWTAIEEGHVFYRQLSPISVFRIIFYLRLQASVFAGF